jgi:predicted nucleic acid-binding protein
MTAFADTNWLEALYIEPHEDDVVGLRRAEIAERRSRKEKTLTTSHVVLIEARNVFSRVTKRPLPEEWKDLVSDFNGRIFVDPMNWDLLRRDTDGIFEKFSHKIIIGTFDATIVASARLAGARSILSFDEKLKAIAVALGLNVFPELNLDGRAFLAKIRAR